MAVVDLILSVVRAVVFVYDVVTYPVYSMVQKSWHEKTKQNLGLVRRKRLVMTTMKHYRASFQVHCTGQSSGEVSFRREKGNSAIYEEIIVKNK